MKTWRYFLHALSPLHVGTGQGEGIIDLPIVRDPATEHPLVPGSSTKGVLREAATRRSERDVTDLFGPDTHQAHLHSGSLRVSDARLLLLPVRSDSGTFAWVTSPLALARLLRDLDGPAPFTIPPVDKGCLVSRDSVVQDGGRLAVVLAGRELAVKGEVSSTLADELSGWLFGSDPWWVSAFRQRLVLVPDDELTFFARHGTDVRAHIRMDHESGTVAGGGLWYQESLPAETILSGFLQAAPNGRVDTRRIAEFVESIAGARLQVGGHASTGMGVCRFLVAGRAP